MFNPLRMREGYGLVPFSGPGDEASVTSTSYAERIHESKIKKIICWYVALNI